MDVANLAMEKVILTFLLTLTMIHVGSCAAIIAQPRSGIETVCVEPVNLTAISSCDTTVRQVYTILSDSDDNLLIGSTECLYVLNKTSDTWSSVSLPIDPADTTCRTLQTDGISVDFLCRNYIRFGFELNTTTFQVCGTNNRQNPRCWVCTRNGETLSCSVSVETNLGNMPSDPIRNHTATLINNNGMDIFFVTSRPQLSSEDVRFSTVNAVSGNEELRNLENNDQWLYTPNNQERSVHFVGEPIEYGPYIYFFFRERALEHYLQASTEVIYSRVARVCKNDAGGATNPLSDRFTTFLKTRLVCSSGAKTDYPFIYDSVQDVTSAATNSSIVYGLFTTTRFRRSSTAICRYDLEELDSLFTDDVRRGQVSSDQLWTQINRVYDEQVERSIRMCQTAVGNLDSTTVATGYPYLANYPLLNTNAPNCGLGQTCDDYSRQPDDALVVLEGIRGQQIAINSDLNDHIDVYVGTNYRDVYRVNITATEALITEKVKIYSCDLSSEQCDNRYPYAVSSLVAGSDIIYGTLDNAVFLLRPDQTTTCQVSIEDRTSDFYEIANHTTRIFGAVTNVFKIFEAPRGFGMVADFYGVLNGSCTQKAFQSPDNNKEVLHVHCVVKNITASDNTSSINVTCTEPGCKPLVVQVAIGIDDSDQPPEEYREDDFAEVERIDMEMASYRYWTQQWIKNNVTCPSNNTCPSGWSCSYVEP